MPEPEWDIDVVALCESLCVIVGDIVWVGVAESELLKLIVLVGGTDAVLERLTLRDTRTQVYGTVALWSLSPSRNKEDTPQNKRVD